MSEERPHLSDMRGMFAEAYASEIAAGIRDRSGRLMDRSQFEALLASGIEAAPADTTQSGVAVRQEPDPKGTP